MVGLAIFAILLMLAVPAFNQYMGDSRIRNTADSIAQGLRLAQVEALKRNRDVQFIVDAGGWRINDPAPVIGGVVQNEPFSHTASVTVTPAPPGSAMIVFSGLGQFRAPPDPAAPAPAPVQQFDVTAPSMTSPHALRVVADPALGIGMRLCDPLFSSVDPDPVKASIGCP
jgi:type IV fimbrial biogenesis protein FimT